MDLSHGHTPVTELRSLSSVPKDLLFDGLYHVLRSPVSASPVQSSVYFIASGPVQPQVPNHPRQSSPLVSPSPKSPSSPLDLLSSKSPSSLLVPTSPKSPMVLPKSLLLRMFPPSLPLSPPLPKPSSPSAPHPLSPFNPWLCPATRTSMLSEPCSSHKYLWF